MPGIVTHFIFGQTVLNNLSTEDRLTITKHEQIFNIGTQGPDMFFYYIPGLLKRELKQLGLILHKQKTGEFFKRSLIEMDKLEGIEREIAFSYIAGYLTHYALDYKTHKYIYYKTGFRKKGRPISSNKFSILHKNLETNIDIMLYNVLSEETTEKKRTWELLNANRQDANTITKVISRSVEDVYGRYVNKRDVINAILYMKNITKFLGTGADNKNHIYRALKKDLSITDVELKQLEILQNTLNCDYLNLRKQEWYSPCDINEKHTETFIDLYLEGVESCIEIISALFDFCNHKISLDELMIQIGNYSMATGLDCNSDKPFIYYDLIKKDKIKKV